MSVNRASAPAYTPNYSIDQIMQTAQTPRASGFRRVLGGIVGGVGNVFAPGLGSAIGGMISGGINTNPGLGEATQYLELQRSMQAESRAFEAASAVLKSRHDASMSAIRNMK